MLSLNKELLVLDHGFVAIEAFEAGDLSVVNSARVSLAQHHEWMTDRDEGLIKSLMKNKHGTPFEHNFFRFRIKAPIVVFREWHRHRIGHSYNEWSARYIEMPNEFYIPEYVRSQVGKSMSYEYEPVNEVIGHAFRLALLDHCDKGYKLYREALTRGIAKEQARLFLSLNLYSEMYWSCNARSLMAFLELRNAPQAMYEIKKFAEVIEALFEMIMPHTCAAFMENGRVAP